MGDATGGNRRFPLGAMDEPKIGVGGPVVVARNTPEMESIVAVDRYGDAQSAAKKKKRAKKLPPKPDAKPSGPVRSGGKPTPAPAPPAQRSGGKPPQYGGKNPMDVMLGIGSAPPGRNPRVK